MQTRDQTRNLQCSSHCSIHLRKHQREACDCLISMLNANASHSPGILFRNYAEAIKGRRWERAPTAKTVTKLLSKAGENDGLQSSGTMGHTLAKALGDLPEYSQGSSTLHPHHICIELDDMAKQSIGNLPAFLSSRGKAQMQMFAKVQRRLQLYSWTRCPPLGGQYYKKTLLYFKGTDS